MRLVYIFMHKAPLLLIGGAHGLSARSCLLINHLVGAEASLIHRLLVRSRRGNSPLVSPAARRLPFWLAAHWVSYSLIPLDNTPLVWPGLLPVVFHAAPADYEEG